MGRAVELAPYKAEYSITRGGSDYGEGQRYLTQTNAGEWQLYGHTDISWFILSDERTTESVFRVNDEQDLFPSTSNISARAQARIERFMPASMPKPIKQ